MSPRRPSAPAPARALRAFTLIEITIALAVVAFALVAIVGVLPIGLNVQRDNRAETIVHHDGTFWMEALRGGSQGLDELVNYVEFIVLQGPSGQRVVRNKFIDPTEPTFSTGREIMGLLGTSLGETNAVAYALVRSITGVASEKPGATTSPTSPGLDFAFKYRLQVEVVPGADVAEDFNSAAGAVGSGTAAEPLTALYDVRLRFSWPVVKSSPNGLPGAPSPPSINDYIAVGRRQKNLRSMASRYLLSDTNLISSVPPVLRGYFLVP